MGRVSSAVVALEGAETATDSEAEIVGKMQPKGKVHNDFSAILFLYLFFFFFVFSLSFASLYQYFTGKRKRRGGPLGTPLYSSPPIPRAAALSLQPRTRYRYNAVSFARFFSVCYMCSLPLSLFLNY